MKKIFCLMLSIVMILSTMAFSVCAADEINFKLRIENETDNDLTLTLDYDGGTGFSALDVDISFDRLRLELKSCEKGYGYADFEEFLNSQGALSICSINQTENPIKVSMANTIGYKTVEAEKSVLVLKFAKVPGTKFVKEDVTFDFTNCQTAAFTDIEVDFDYDMTLPEPSKTESTSQGATEYPQMTSADNVDDVNDSEIGDPVAQAPEGSETAENNGNSETDETLEEKNNTTIIIIIVAAVAVIAIAGGFALVKFKGKKKAE